LQPLQAIDVNKLKGKVKVGRNIEHSKLKSTGLETDCRFYLILVVNRLQGVLVSVENVRAKYCGKICNAHLVPGNLPVEKASQFEVK